LYGPLLAFEAPPNVMENLDPKGYLATFGIEAREKVKRPKANGFL
jgi:hypothetical protein